MRTLTLITIAIGTLFFASCGNSNKPTNDTTPDHKNNPYYSRTDTTHLHVSDADWKRILPADVYDIARAKGTESAYSGKYWKSDTKGIYYCAVCGNPLFRSDAKFASVFIRICDARDLRFPRSCFMRSLSLIFASNDSRRARRSATQSSK